MDPAKQEESPSTEQVEEMIKESYFVEKQRLTLCELMHTNNPRIWIAVILHRAWDSLRILLFNQN